MLVTFLGTSAAEEYPALWCECPNCAWAREAGGRNIRKNSCAMVDGDILLDMGPSVFARAGDYGRSLRGVRHLLVTHAHADHFYPQWLTWRRMAAGLPQMPPEEQHKRSQGCFTELTPLRVYGNEHVREAMAGCGIDVDEGAQWSLSFTQVEPGVPIEADGLRITPLATRHGVPGFCCHYILQRGGKTLLYATDGDAYPPEMEAILRGHRFDCVIAEGTFGLLDKDLDGHRGLQKNIAFLRFFDENGLWAGAPQMVITHVSPHWAPPHDQYAPLLQSHGMELAYDGMTLEV